MMIEITTNILDCGCIMNCLFCPQPTLLKNYKSNIRMLSFNDYKKAIDKIPSNIEIRFAGFSEPWLNKKTTDMILYAHEKGHKIYIFTTGVGLSAEAFKRIEHITFEMFVLHLPDKQQNAHHNITPEYIETIKYLKENVKVCRSSTWTKRNLTLDTMHMGVLHDSVKDIFPDSLNYQMSPRAYNLKNEYNIKPELKKKFLREINHGEGNYTCNFPEGFHRNVMLPNGDMYLCCMDYGLEHKLGNIFEEDYLIIINRTNKTDWHLCQFCEWACRV